MNKKIRYLAAIDVDGTLLNSRHQLTERVLKSLKRSMDSGIAISLSTGKHISAVRNIIETVGILGPQITSNGALVSLAESGEVIYRRVIPTSSAQDVLDISNELGITIVLVHENGTFTTKFNRDVDYMMSFGDTLPEEVPDLYQLIDPPPIQIKLAAYRKRELLEDANASLNRRLGNLISIQKSSSYNLEITHLEVSKGVALNRVAAYFGIDARRVIAIGDSYNDISMFQFAGHSIAMSTSPESVIRVADETTKSSDEDGVALALERHFDIE